jgi:hypothetical protein
MLRIWPHDHVSNLTLSSKLTTEFAAVGAEKLTAWSASTQWST